MQSIDEAMKSWRDGLLSNYEILAILCTAQAEVIGQMGQEETKAADERCARLGV